MTQPRQTYSEEVKAAAMAALLTGQSISQVAKEYKIPRGTVAAWASQTGRQQLVATTKKERIGELLVEYLEASLTTLRKQVEYFSDDKWLYKQTASEAAVLHGVIADKAVRLLEALAGDDAEEISDEAGD